MPPRRKHRTPAEAAVRLFEDGYSIRAVTWRSNAGVTRPVPGLFIVTSPEGNRYRIDLLRGFCSCPATVECKHKLGALRLCAIQAITTQHRLQRTGLRTSADRRESVQAGVLLAAFRVVTGRVWWEQI